MTKTPILKQTFYTDLFRYIFIKGEARSYEITKKFNPIKKRGKCTDQKQIKNNKINFSMKLQNLKNLGFIKVIKKGSRGRHGKYSVYTINYKGIVEFIYGHYFNYKKINPQPDVEILIKYYLLKQLNKDEELKSLDYYFDYIITNIGYYYNHEEISKELKTNFVFLKCCEIYVHKKLFKESLLNEENLL